MIGFRWFSLRMAFQVPLHNFTGLYSKALKQSLIVRYHQQGSVIIIFYSSKVDEENTQRRCWHRPYCLYPSILASCTHPTKSLTKTCIRYLVAELLSCCRHPLECLKKVTLAIAFSSFLLRRWRKTEKRM